MNRRVPEAPTSWTVRGMGRVYWTDAGPVITGRDGDDIERVVVTPGPPHSAWQVDARLIDHYGASMVRRHHGGGRHR